MLPAPDHVFSRAGFWRHCAEFNDCADGILRVYAGGKDWAVVRFFLRAVDIFFANVLGFNAMIYMYIGYANGKFNRIFFPEEIKLPLVLILVSDLIYGFSYYVILFLLRGKFNLGFYFLHIILPEMVYTILVTLLLYPLILWLNKKLEEAEQRSARKFV